MKKIFYLRNNSVEQINFSNLQFSENEPFDTYKAKNLNDIFLQLNQNIEKHIITTKKKFENFYKGYYSSSFFSKTEKKPGNEKLNYFLLTNNVLCSLLESFSKSLDNTYKLMQLFFDSFDFSFKQCSLQKFLKENLNLIVNSWFLNLICSSPIKTNDIMSICELFEVDNLSLTLDSELLFDYSKRKKNFEGLRFVGRILTEDRERLNNSMMLLREIAFDGLDNEEIDKLELGESFQSKDNIYPKVTSVEISNCSFEGLEFLQRCPNISKLKVKSSLFQWNFKANTFLLNLRHLTLKRIGLTDKGLQSIFGIIDSNDHLKHLDTLDLSWNLITSVILDKEVVKFIKSMSFEHNNIYFFLPKGDIDLFINLRSNNIHYINHLSNFNNEKYFVLLSNNPVILKKEYKEVYLPVLNKFLANNTLSIPKLSLEKLYSPRDLKHFLNLNLSIHTQITLKVLDLSSCGLSNDFIVQMFLKHKYLQIEELKLCNNLISDDLIKLMLYYCKWICNELVKIDLSDNEKIEGKEMKKLIEFSNLKKVIIIKTPFEHRIRKFEEMKMGKKGKNDKKSNDPLLKEIEEIFMEIVGSGWKGKFGMSEIFKKEYKEENKRIFFIPKIKQIEIPVKEKFIEKYKIVDEEGNRLEQFITQYFVVK